MSLKIEVQKVFKEVLANTPSAATPKVRGAATPKVRATAVMKRKTPLQTHKRKVNEVEDVTEFVRCVRAVQPEKQINEVQPEKERIEDQAFFTMPEVTFLIETYN